MLNENLNKIDLYRTPVYPFLIYLLHQLFGYHCFKYLIIFQQLVSFATIICIYQILKESKSVPLIIFFTLLYGCYPSIIKWSSHINPESLSISVIVTLFYLFNRFKNSYKLLHYFYLITVVILLIFLKPTFLSLIVLLLVVWMIKLVLQKAHFKKWIIFSIINLFYLSNLFIYAKLNQIYNQEFVISKISLNNSIGNVILCESYKYGKNKEFIQIINQNIHSGIYNCIFIINNEWIDHVKKCNVPIFQNHLTAEYDVASCMKMKDYHNYSTKQIHEFIHNSKNSNAYKRFIFNNFITIFKWKLMASFVVLFYIFYTLFSFFRYKKFNWNIIFCLLLILSQYFTIALWGFSAFDRVFLPCIPIFMYLVFHLCQLIIKKIEQKSL